MTPPTSPSALVDTELLDLVQVVLRDAKYTVASMSAEGVPAILAEDQDNVVIVSAVLTAADMLTIEPSLNRALSERLTTVSAEAKKWDGYVIVLTSTRPDDATSDALFSLTYNLHQVRRLLRVGVEATTAAVARSLRPVLPLDESRGAATLVDPLTALGQRLVSDGLNETDVATAISSFRAQSTAQAPVGSAGSFAPLDTDAEASLDADAADDDV